MIVTNLFIFIALLSLTVKTEILKSTYPKPSTPGTEHNFGTERKLNMTTHQPTENYTILKLYNLSFALQPNTSEASKPPIPENKTSTPETSTSGSDWSTVIMLAGLLLILAGLSALTVVWCCNRAVKLHHAAKEGSRVSSVAEISDSVFERECLELQVVSCKQSDTGCVETFPLLDQSSE